MAKDLAIKGHGTCCHHQADWVTPYGLCPLCLFEDGEPSRGGHEAGIEVNIPGYVIIERIGQGGFATVFEALQLQPVVRPAAIKLLNTSAASTVRRLEDEAMILANLHHPGIVPIWDAGTLPGGRAWFSMPLLSGNSFQHWLEQSCPDAKTIADVLKKMAEAVAYAHAHGVLHRDLKPSNVVITEAGEQCAAQPVLIDFGLGHAQAGPASLGREATVIGTWMGTPLYMAPEQMAGEEATAATDIHALGLFLAEALIGHPAMENVVNPEGSRSEWLKRREQWRWPEDAATRGEAPLRWIAQRALCFEPEERYATAQEMAEDLQRWLEGRAVAASGSRWRYRCKCFLRRNRRLVAAATVSALLVAGIWTATRLHLDRVHREELVRTEAAAVHARALEDFREGMGDRALESLEATLAKSPGNPDLQFTARALRALAPSAIRLPDLELPFPPQRVTKVEQGWLIEDANGKSYVVDFEGGISEAQDSDLQDLKNPADPPAPLLVRFGPGSRLSFCYSDDGLPALQPIHTGNLPGEITIHWKQGLVAKSNGSRKLRRWDIRMVGQSRDQHHFSSSVPWFAFERNRPNLWMRHQDGGMRGWRLGEAPGRAVNFSAFDSAIEHDQIGENHSRGTSPGWDGLRMLAELAHWHARHPHDKIAAVAGARDEDHVAFGTKQGRLLFWTPAKGLQEELRLVGTPAVMAIDSIGQNLVAIDAQGHAECFDMQDGRKTQSWKIDQAATSASFLDSLSPEHPPILIIGTATGEIMAYDSRKVAELWRLPLAEERVATNRPVQVYGLPGGESFLAGIWGGYQLEVRQAANGEPDGEAFPMGKGLGFFFLSADGRIVVALDQAASGPGALRLLGLNMRRDLIPPLPQQSRVLWGGLAMNGGVLAVATDDGRVTRWFLKEDKK